MAMPSHPRVVQAARRLKRWLPRILTLIWALWCVATAVAYVHHVPEQLQTVDGAVKAPVWGIWATAAILLTVGALAPSTAPQHLQNTARWARIIGMTITCAMLILWAVAFCVAEPRGWVSGKNYALLAIMALVATWPIARDTVSHRGVIRQ